MIEGCYGDLLQIVAPQACEILYLNMSIETCTSNPRNRPWEPHKYVSKQAQDKNLQMLIHCIGEYSSRTDEYSEMAHLDFYRQHLGIKKMYRQNISY